MQHPNDCRMLRLPPGHEEACNRAAEQGAAGQLSQMPALNGIGFAADNLSLPRQFLRTRTIRELTCMLEL